MTILIYWLLFGLGFYTACAVKERRTFKYATLCEKLRGLVLGILLWPVAIFVVIFD